MIINAGKFGSPTLSIVLVLAAFNEGLLADDLNPPPWLRLGAMNLSTSAEWDFDEDGTNPLQPDGDSVPLIVGDFNDDLNGMFPGNGPYPSALSDAGLTYTANSGFLGTGASGGRLEFNIPNWYNLQPDTYLRIQVTYTGTRPETSVEGFHGPPNNFKPITVTRRVSGSGTVGTSSYFHDNWYLRPWIDWERISVMVPNGTFIDQVVIDTIAIVPEPSTWTIGTFGLVAICSFAISRCRRPQ
jgi:hypothetical protein